MIHRIATRPKLWPGFPFLCVFLFFFVGCGVTGPAQIDDDSGDEPTVVDAEPGTLVITQPARASFIATGQQVVVEGSGATEALTLDGQPVTVQPDGSFQVQVEPTVGLNILRLEDGASAIEVPFLYGDFSPQETIVAAAARLRINAGGFDNINPSELSLAGLARSFLETSNVLDALVGQSFDGNVTLASYRFDVEKASYGNVLVKLNPEDGGPRFEAEVADVHVGGKLKISALFSWTDQVALKAKRIKVEGKLKALFKDKAIEAEADDIKTKLDGFRYDSNNGGFPCCVDDIITSILRPIVEKELRNAVKEQTKEGFSFALNQLGLPTLIDLNPGADPALPIDAQVELTSELDDAVFDDQGLTLSLAANFRAPEGSTLLHAQAPGWLYLNRPPEPIGTDSPFGITISLDALNQALYAVWVQGGLELNMGDMQGLTDLRLSAQLPPVFSVEQEGTVRAGIGEVILSGGFNGNNVRAAVSILDDVALKLDPDTQKLGLALSNSPLVSFTWLDDGGLVESLRDVLRAVVIDQVPQLLAPLSIPLPTLPLDGLSPNYTNQSAVMGPDTQVQLHASDQRAKLLGRLIVAESP